MVALLCLKFPSGTRFLRAASARVESLCDAAAPLLADIGRSSQKPAADASQLDVLMQVRTHAIRNSMHDLQTPMVALFGFLRLMLREEAGPLTSAQKEYLGTMRENMERVRDEVAELSESIKHHPLRFAPFDLAGAWPGLLLQIQRGAAATVKIEASFSIRPFPVTADASSLTKALETLIGYVIRRTADGNQVTVAFHRGEEIVVRISTGGGRFLEDEQPGGASRGQADELAAARKILRLHGGGVSVSRNDSALTVTVTLPSISWKEPSDLENVHEQAFDSCSG